jgi:O-glycosyl hydrolase
MCVFFAVILSSFNSYGDINVLTNPGFEAGNTNGWSARYDFGSIDVVTSPVHSGSYAGRCYDRDYSWQGIQQDLLGKMVTGQTYSLSAWARTNSSTSATIRMYIVKTDFDGTDSYQVDSASVSDSGWVELSGNYTLTVNGALLELYILFYGPFNGVDFYIDDASVYGPQLPPPTGEINANVRHQILDAFGGAGCYDATQLPNHTLREEVYDLLFDELGIDVYRIRNTYGYDTANITATSTIIAEAKQRNPNLKIMASAWSPPDDLKSTGDIIAGTLAGGPDNYVYEDYADWWADSLDYWMSRDVRPDYISIQNEPDIETDYDSCYFSPTENTDFAGYDQAFEAVYQELYSRMGPNMPKMLAPETMGISGGPEGGAGAYIDALPNLDHVYGFAHHLYTDGFGYYNPDSKISAMLDFNSNYGYKPLFQTEYADQMDWIDAFNTARHIMNSLVYENVNSYYYWSIFRFGSAATAGGVVTLTSGSTYIIRPTFYALKQFAHFTDPNWQRIDASMSDSRLRICSFISPDEQQISTIVINTKSESFDVNLPITGFSVGAGEYYRTSSTKHCELIGTYDGSGNLTFPGNSITTLVVWSDDPPSPPAGLAATPGNFQVSLDWLDSPEADADGYNIYRSQTSGSDYEKLNDSLLDSSNYIDTDVNVAQTYYYVVTAVDKCSAESGYSDEASALPFDATAPAAPTGLVSQAGNSTVSLDWNDNLEEDVNGYNVYRSQTSGSGYVRVNDTLVSSSDYIDNTVFNQTTYYYVVTAVDIYSNESGFSSEVPATPSSVAPTIYNFEGITASDTEYNAFACDVDTFPFESSSDNVNSKVEATDQQYVDISANDTNEWATADAGFLDEIFLWIEMKINETPGDISRIDLTFNGNTGGSADVVHQIYVMKAGTDWTKNSSWVQVGSDMSIPPGVDTTMTRSITSDFSTYIDGATGQIIWAVYETTSSEIMHINYIETSVTGSGDTEPPAAPVGLVATADNDMVSLDWNDNSETDLAGYNVYRSQTSGSGYDKINASLLADSNYVDNDVNNFTTYYYVVTAVDTNNNSSPYSNEVSATPDIYQDCNEVQLGGDGLVSDLTGDCYVDFNDLNIVTDHWLNRNCGMSENCGGADFAPVDGDVDFEDFSDFAMDWLLCNNPVDSSCIKNWWP